MFAFIYDGGAVVLRSRLKFTLFIFNIKHKVGPGVLYLYLSYIHSSGCFCVVIACCVTELSVSPPPPLNILMEMPLRCLDA